MRQMTRTRAGMCCRSARIDRKHVVGSRIHGSTHSFAFVAGQCRRVCQQRVLRAGQAVPVCDIGAADMSALHDGF